ncbi:DUF2637 domain-containing protein [Streptomyces sp. NPDC059015]|uniref:DUF2637 domain-containing protein n=1 Tax=unclassified Streptomyces TaxID=2593676 RepID=UPI003687C1FD
MATQTHEAPATDSGTEPVRRDWLLYAGMGAVGAAAAASSYAALQDLAIRTGWWTQLSWLLPLTIDAYAMTAVRVWLGKSTRNDHARSWAKANAIGAIVLSVAGNAVDHAIAAGVFPVGWLLIVAVSAVPPIVLGLLVHMAHLRTVHPDASVNDSTPATHEGQQSPPPVPSATPAASGDRQPRRRGKNSSKRQDLPPGKSDQELIDAARERIAAGQEPSATWLIKTYGVGTSRAARIRDAALQITSVAPTSAPGSELVLAGGES